MTHTHVKNRYQRSDGSNIEWNQTDGRTRPIAVLTGADPVPCLSDSVLNILPRKFSH